MNWNNHWTGLFQWLL